MAIEDKLIPINIEDEMKSAYIDYSMLIGINLSSIAIRFFI